MLLLVAGVYTLFHLLTWFILRSQLSVVAAPPTPASVADVHLLGRA